MDRFNKKNSQRRKMKLLQNQQQLREHRSRIVVGSTLVSWEWREMADFPNFRILLCFAGRKMACRRIKHLFREHIEINYIINRIIYYQNLVGFGKRYNLTHRMICFSHRNVMPTKSSPEKWYHKSCSTCNKIIVICVNGHNNVDLPKLDGLTCVLPL